MSESSRMERVDHLLILNIATQAFRRSSGLGLRGDGSGRILQSESNLLDAVMCVFCIEAGARRAPLPGARGFDFEALFTFRNSREQSDNSISDRIRVSKKQYNTECSEPNLQTT